MKRRICRWLFDAMLPITLLGSAYTVVAHAWRQGRMQGLQFIEWCHGDTDSQP